MLIAYVNDFDSGSFQEFDAVAEAVFLAIDHALDACLDNEFRALDAGRGRDVDGGSVAVVVRAGELRDGVGLGVEHVGFCQSVFVFADVLESAGRAVVAVADNHFVLHDECAHLPPLAVAVFGPDAGHAQVALVKFLLFFF